QQRIIRDALADPAADLSLTGLASLVQLSRYHFARLFKKTYGLPPHQYVVHQRVEAAKAMLADIDVDPRRLGHSLGFA
ncbi:helix-turn-helix domain-containing protein, partial [Salmonella enterica]|uniref:helix-turn-helix domain-containing protein n=1 Tax=Salmonella enterica TaxID=28901 RepID=UPI003D2B3EEB